MHVTKSVPLLTALTVVGAWDFSFFPWRVASGVNAEQIVTGGAGLKPQPVRVAIVGAGAGGSSAAFWIQKAKERHGTDVEVHVFDKESYVGGRARIVHPYDDESLPSEELGASIFVQANKNLFRAVEEFNLTLTDLSEEEDSEMSIWDGNQIILTYSGTWWDNIKMLWRYGYSSPNRAKAMVQNMVNSLMAAYTPLVPSWATITQLSDAIGFTQFTAQTGYDFYSQGGVGDRFIYELIDGATRVNYAQDVTSIHGLEAACSMAAGGASQVLGGNYQIFEQFVKRSEAKLFLNTTITGLSKSDASGKAQWSLSGSADVPKVKYDHVIIAAPFHTSGISLKGSTAEFIPTVDYIHLHVTLVATTSFRPLAEKFNLKPGSSVSRTILTTADGIRHGGPAPDFHSLSYHRTITHNGREEYIFKIFSLDHKSDEWLEGLFGEGSLGWVYRKGWDSYPKLPPTTHFPPIRADDGLWYINSFEPFISTMETETLSSRNVVDNLLQETFGHGICTNSTTSSEGWEPTVDEKKVYGWDC